MNVLEWEIFKKRSFYLCKYCMSVYQRLNKSRIHKKMKKKKLVHEEVVVIDDDNNDDKT